LDYVNHKSLVNFAGGSQGTEALAGYEATAESFFAAGLF
jgi:hypothetical protein